MATTRLSRPVSVSLSLTLHGALFFGLLVLGIVRRPAEQPPVLQVVWVESGLPDLAATRHGDGGLATVAESDPAAAPMPDASPVEPDEHDQPAPTNPDAENTVSAADRPAPAPADEPTDTPDPMMAESVDEQAPIEDDTAKPADAPTRDAPVVAARESISETMPSSEREPEPEPAPERLSEATPSQPLTAEEQESMREQILDRLNRSRDLASRPSLAWSRNGREYRAEITRMPAAGAMGIEAALLEITTDLDGRQVSTEMRLKRLAFSHYAQLIDRWDPSVQIHDDVIDGRFHSNSEILIENSGGTQPVFYGKVTTAGGVDTSRSSRRVRRGDVFLGGLDTQSPRIVLPRRFAPVDGLNADDAEVIELDGDAHVVFRADGSYLLRVGEGGRTTAGRLSAMPTYFVAAQKSTVGVKGTLNGKVLVYAPRGIVIEGDLVYAADPIRAGTAGGTASDDYLGLVSDGTIEVAGPDVTGDGDLTIHAAIYAKGRFAVRRYSRAERATLTIYGSLSAGSLTATEPRFRTKLVFDPRLEEMRPPSFPMTNRYEVAAWDGVWRAEPE